MGADKRLCLTVSAIFILGENTMKQLLALLLLSSALAAWGTPATTYADGAPAPDALAECKFDDGGLPNLGKLKSCLKDYHSSQYMAAVNAVEEAARKMMEEQIASNMAHGKLALVLDIDETSLSNWEQIVADDFGYFADGPCDLPVKGPCGAAAFDQLSRAAAIKPTLDLFNFAVAHGVTVFFITGREGSDAERNATELNLWRAGYHGWKTVYMREPNGRDKGASTEAYKTGRREEIERDGYTIIANLGDQWSDLKGGHPDQRFDFKLPNPFYYIP